MIEGLRNYLDAPSVYSPIAYRPAYGFPEEPLVSAELLSKANPMDALFQNVWLRLIYLLFWSAYITVFWFILGPASKVAEATTPWYGLSVAWATSALVVVVPAPGVMRHVPLQWFRVPTGESVIHRVLGVGVFGRLLDVAGWNRRVLKPLRGFSGKKTGLLHLENGVRASALSHGICFGIHMVLAVLALFTRHPWRGALWMLLPGVPIHLYPLLLQRSIMLRLQPLLDKTGSRRSDTEAT